MRKKKKKRDWHIQLVFSFPRILLQKPSFSPIFFISRLSPPFCILQWAILIHWVKWYLRGELFRSEKFITYSLSCHPRLHFDFPLILSENSCVLLSVYVYLMKTTHPIIRQLRLSLLFPCTKVKKRMWCCVVSVHTSEL